MSEEFTYIISGIVFGLGAGLTPGPLMTLVVTETLKHGSKEGVKVSMAPLITDVPIIVLSIFLLTELAGLDMLIGSISVIGAGYIVFLGYESITFKGVDVDPEKIVPRSIRKGILANILNPNPYVFWISVGAPMILKASDISWGAPFLFIFFMYLFLVGSKVITAMIIGKSRQFLNTKAYIYLLRGLGVVLFVFAYIYFYDGLKLIGVI